MAATAAKNQRRRGQNTTAVAGRGDSIGMPVTEGGASSVCTATANSSETVALVDAAERASDITQLAVDSVTRTIVMVLVIAVAGIVVIIMVITVVVVIIIILVVMMMAARPVFVLGRMLGIWVFSFLNILIRSRLFVSSQRNATSPSDEKC